MAKKKLVVEPDLDFLLIAISCHEKDYRLCWHLNKTLQMELTRMNDYELPGKKGVISTHPHYSWFDEFKRIRYTLLANRGDRGWLAEDQKPSDYFLVIDGSLEVAEPELLVSLIRKIEIVQTAFEIEVPQFKSATSFVLG